MFKILVLIVASVDCVNYCFYCTCTINLLKSVSCTIERAVPTEMIRPDAGRLVSIGEYSSQRQPQDQLCSGDAVGEEEVLLFESKKRESLLTFESICMMASRCSNSDSNL
jgi:hypothetical protein